MFLSNEDLEAWENYNHEYIGSDGEWHDISEIEEVSEDYN